MEQVFWDLHTRYSSSLTESRQYGKKEKGEKGEKEGKKK